MTQISSFLLCWAVSDPSDNRFLEAALEGRALAIVSGDNHLLELGNFRGVPILSAREFIEQLDSAE